MISNADDYFNALLTHRVLPEDRVATLRAGWQSAGSSGPADDLDRLGEWLVGQGALTEHQAGVVRRGNARQLTVGPYRIQERIGKGRMAGVYRAVHDLGLVVAIKVLPPSKAAVPTTLARFQREARVALNVKHPNVVRSFHTGTHDGLHYLVMEHLDGDTLEEVLARRGGRLAVPEAVWVAHQALLGLHAIHDAGLLHRDIKPGNLMVVGGGGAADSIARAAVKLLDLGAVRALFDEEGGAAPAAEHDLTRPGELLGDIEYLSPEQARSPQSIDIRSDIYSVGCVLYRMLAGSPPFADPSRVRLLLMHATEAPPPLPSRVPAGLARAALALLAKSPEERPATPREAAKLLEQFIEQDELSGPRAQPTVDEYLGWVNSLDGQSLGSATGQSVMLAELLSPPPAPENSPMPEAKPPQAKPPRRDRAPAADDAPRKAKRPAPPPPPPPAERAVTARRRREERDEGDGPEEAASDLSVTHLVLVSLGAMLGVVVLGVLCWLVYRLVT